MAKYNIKGCGKKFLKKGNIILSIKCGDWDLDKQEIRYCKECKKLNEEANKKSSPIDKDGK